MFYYFIVLATIFTFGINFFIQYNSIDHKTEVALKTKNILTKVNNIQEIQNKKNIDYINTSIYDLNLPMSNYMINLNYNNNNLNMVNLLKSKIDIFLKTNPLVIPTCLTLKNNNLLNNNEYNNCIDFNNENIDFFKDDINGIRYKINDPEINTKLINFNLNTNKSVNSNTYIYNNLSNDSYTNNTKLIELKNNIDNFLNNKEYVSYINSLKYLYIYNKDLYYNYIDDFSNKINTGKITLSDYQNNLFIQQILIYIYSKNNEQLINIQNYNDLKLYIQNNQNAINQNAIILNYDNPNNTYNNIMN